MLSFFNPNIEKVEVQAIVEDINKQTEELWQMMFYSAVMEQDLNTFEHYLHSCYAQKQLLY